jgi:hypothetical protein
MPATQPAEHSKTIGEAPKIAASNVLDRGSLHRQAPITAATKPFLNGLLQPPRVAALVKIYQQIRVNYGTAQAGSRIAELTARQDDARAVRGALQALDSTPSKGVLGGFLQAVKSGFGLFSSTPRARLEAELSTTVDKLKEFCTQVIDPMVQEIQQQHAGLKFTRTAETPRALVLASVPTAKVGKVLSFDDFARGMINLPQGVQVREVSDGRVQVLRAKPKGKPDVLEFSFRRPGKVDVVLNGQLLGAAWTDDALKMAQRFAVRGDIKVATKVYTDYTVEAARDQKAA